MKLLLLYWAVILVGYLVGSQMRKRKKEIKGIRVIQTVAVIILVFLMGSRLGANPEIVQGLGSIGLKALILTLFIITGSILSVFIMRKIFKINKEGVRESD